eukprot:2327128-Prymnesium_polylepis.1
MACGPQAHQRKVTPCRVNRRENLPIAKRLSVWNRGGKSCGHPERYAPRKPSEREGAEREPSRDRGAHTLPS